MQPNGTSCCRSSCSLKPPSFWARKNRQKISYQICMAQRPKSLAVTKMSKIYENLDIGVITILQEPQRRVKFSTNFAVRITIIQVQAQWVITIVCGKETTFWLFLFLLGDNL